jgi:TonB family protein
MTELSDKILVAYVDGQLALKQTRAVEKVLEQDDVVAARAKALKEGRARLKTAFEAILVSEVDDVPELTSRLASVEQRKRWDLKKPTLIAAGVAILLVAFGVSHGWPPMTSPGPLLRDLGPQSQASTSAPTDVVQGFDGKAPAALLEDIASAGKAETAATRQVPMIIPRTDAQRGNFIGAKDAEPGVVSFNPPEIILPVEDPVSKASVASPVSQIVDAIDEPVVDETIAAETQSHLPHLDSALSHGEITGSVTMDGIASSPDGKAQHSSHTVAPNAKRSYAKKTSGATTGETSQLKTDAGGAVPKKAESLPAAKSSTNDEASPGLRRSAKPREIVPRFRVKPFALGPARDLLPKKDSVGRASASHHAAKVRQALGRHTPKSVRTSGSVTVSFAIDGGGRLRSARISRSSGKAQLDQTALATVRKAGPFPRPPGGSQRSYTITINFR